MNDSRIPLLTDIVDEPDERRSKDDRLPVDTLEVKDTQAEDERQHVGDARDDTDSPRADYGNEREFAETINLTFDESPLSFDDDIFVFEPVELRRRDPQKRAATASDARREPTLGDAEEFVDYAAERAAGYDIRQDDIRQDDLRQNDRLVIADIDTVVAELQTRIASHTYELTDELMRAAFAEIEAKVFRQISTRLREQLPEMIDSVVREELLERARRTRKGD